MFSTVRIWYPFRSWWPFHGFGIAVRPVFWDVAFVEVHNTLQLCPVVKSCVRFLDIQALSLVHSMCYILPASFKSFIRPLYVCCLNHSVSFAHRGCFGWSAMWPDLFLLSSAALPC